MRFYEAKFPEVDDYVMVKVTEIADMGAYVQLLEYDNHEGMIQFSELSRRRIRSVSKLIRVGKQEICIVLRVDKEKGYIDLSKRRVNPEDIAATEAKYNKSKTVHQILRHVAEVTEQDFEYVLQTVAWPLYQKFGHAYDALKLSIKEPEKVLADIQFKDEAMKKLLLQQVENRLKPPAVKLRADIEVTCFGSQGIDGIKAALKEGEKMGTKEHPLKIQLIAPPLYVITTSSNDVKVGISLLEKCVDVIKEELKEHYGKLEVKAEPRSVTQKDDHSLNLLFEQLKEQNKEVDGDDESEEEFIGM